jgi:hypothetical protein
MADCEALVDTTFVKTVTGVDVSDTDRVESLIVIASTLIGEEFGACVDPDEASMRLRTVCANYVAYMMTSGAGGAAGALRAEQIGDYRVEYQGNRTSESDLQVLRDMLSAMYGGSAYSVGTLVEKRETLAVHDLSGLGDLEGVVL